MFSPPLKSDALSTKRSRRSKSKGTLLLTCDEQNRRSADLQNQVGAVAGASHLQHLELKHTYVWPHQTIDGT